MEEHLKTACKMFNELGYELTENTKFSVTYEKNTGDIYVDRIIWFDVSDKTYNIKFADTSWDTSIDVDTLKAIYQQAKELEWIE